MMIDDFRRLVAPLQRPVALKVGRAIIAVNASAPRAAALAQNLTARVAGGRPVKVRANA